MSETTSATTALLKKTAGKKASKVAEAQTDTLVETAHLIENLDQDSAIQMADELIDKTGYDEFVFGGVIAKMQENAWFEGYDNLKSMIEEKYDMKYRKALYLVDNYRNVIDNQIPWETVKDLGWTKLNKIGSVINADNVADWAAKAKNMTVLQLEAAVKAYKAAQAGETDASEGGTITSTVTTLTFKLHEDQKEVVREALNKAKAETNTEFDTVAIVNICTGYLGGTVNIDTAGGAGADMKSVMEAHTFEEVLMVFEQVFPDVDLTVAS